MSEVVRDLVGYNLDFVVGRGLGFDDNFLELLDRERKYKSALNHWESFKSWERNRNPARAANEAKFGYDTKHASMPVI